jgi:hypothetical protein
MRDNAVLLAMMATLQRVISEANCALRAGCGDYGVDDRDTLRRVLDRVSKAKCLCEEALARPTEEEVKA